jgi:hypothetical protein
MGIKLGGDYAFGAQSEVWHLGRVQPARVASRRAIVV